MPDQFTDYSSQSWFSRIGGAFVGLIFGIILVPVSVILLFWNEGRAVTTEKSLKEGAASVVSAGADTVVPANEGKLIHLTGEVAAGGTIRDPLFNVSANALRLTRHVEMYEWKEEEKHETHKKFGGGEETETTYSYTKEWSKRPINSADFKHPQDHTNPQAFPLEDASALASKATLGAFKVPQEIISQMSEGERMSVTDEALAPLPPDLKAKAKVAGEGVYLGADPSVPAVGDVRVTFKALQPGTFSILAQQSGDSLAAHATKAGREIERVESGTVSAAGMFQHAESENKLITWLVRIGGFVLMFIGFAVVLNPIKVFADVLPFVGGIVGFGTGLLAAILAFAGSLVVIAVAWLAARPLLGGSLLVIALVAIVHGIRKVREHHLAASAGAKPA